MIYKVTLKDWERMQDLLDRDQNGEGVADKIKDVKKAVARYVAGMHLLHKEPVEEYRYGFGNHTREEIAYSDFRCFGQRALELGATIEDIKDSYNTAHIPEDFFDNHITKDSYTGYTGPLRRLCDQMAEKYGLTVKREYTRDTNRPNNWSYETSRSYNSNGRCWPIDYTITFTKGDVSHSVGIVVVTNEGGGNYGYDIEGCRRSWESIKMSVDNRLKRAFGETV